MPFAKWVTIYKISTPLVIEHPLLVLISLFSLSNNQSLSISYKPCNVSRCATNVASLLENYPLGLVSLKKQQGVNKGRQTSHFSFEIYYSLVFIGYLFFFCVDDICSSPKHRVSSHPSEIEQFGFYWSLNLRNQQKPAKNGKPGNCTPIGDLCSIYQKPCKFIWCGNLGNLRQLVTIY